MRFYLKLSRNKGQIKNREFSKVGDFEFIRAGVKINFTLRKWRVNGHFFCAALNSGARVDYAFHLKRRGVVLAQLALNAGYGGLQAAGPVLQLFAEGEYMLDGGFACCRVAGHYFFIWRIPYFFADIV